MQEILFVLKLLPLSLGVGGLFKRVDTEMRPSLYSTADLHVKGLLSLPLILLFLCSSSSSSLFLLLSLLPLLLLPLVLLLHNLIFLLLVLLLLRGKNCKQICLPTRIEPWCLSTALRCKAQPLVGGEDQLSFLLAFLGDLRSQLFALLKLAVAAAQSAAGLALLVACCGVRGNVGIGMLLRQNIGMFNGGRDGP